VQNTASLGACAATCMDSSARAKLAHACARRIRSWHSIQLQSRQQLRAPASLLCNPCAAIPALRSTAPEAVSKGGKRRGESRRTPAPLRHDVQRVELVVARGGHVPWKLERALLDELQICEVCAHRLRGQPLHMYTAVKAFDVFAATKQLVHVKDDLRTKVAGVPR
jgi:hypothetical protein